MWSNQVASGFGFSVKACYSENPPCRRGWFILLQQNILIYNNYFISDVSFGSFLSLRKEHIVHS
jgi:hypothetical protein